MAARQMRAVGRVKEVAVMKNKIKATRTRFSPVTVFMLVVLVLYSLSLLLLFVWAFFTAFKNNRFDFRTNSYGFPETWEWQNFVTVFTKFRVTVNTRHTTVGMGEMYLNSFLYAVGCAFFNTLVPCVTAYLCARFHYKFSKIVYNTVLIVMVIPVVGSLPSELDMAMRLGLHDHIWGMWVMKANFLGIYFLVFYAHFKGMPDAYTEAAKIDGAGNMSILLRIALPLARNTFFTVMLIYFITYWNDFQTARLYVPSRPTISLGMYFMSITPDGDMSSVPMRCAAAFMVLLPILVVFLCFQQRLLGNITVGGLKG